MRHFQPGDHFEIDINSGQGLPPKWVPAVVTALTSEQYGWTAAVHRTSDGRTVERGPGWALDEIQGLPSRRHSSHRRRGDGGNPGTADHQPIRSTRSDGAAAPGDSPQGPTDRDGRQVGLCLRLPGSDRASLRTGGDQWLISSS